MQKRINTYYKYTWEDDKLYISGCHLPDPSKGPYHFRACDFHPCLDNELVKNYPDSVMENWNGKLIPMTEAIKY